MKKITAAILIAMLVFTSAAPAYAFTFKQAAQLKSEYSEPFIDLAELIGDSEMGRGGNQETSLSGNTDEETEDQNGTGTGAGLAETEAVQTIEQVEMNITVHDTDMKLNGATVMSADALRSSIRSAYKDGMEIRLVDDYAEYNTYLSVLRVLEDLKIKPVEEQKK